MATGEAGSAAGRAAIFGRVGWTACALIALGVVLIVWGSTAGTQRTRGIAAEVALIDETQRLLSTLFSLESSERGFALTGAPEFRAPYDEGIASIGGRLRAIEERWGETGEAPEGFVELREAVEAQNAFAASVVDTRERDGFEAAVILVRSGEGRERMDAVRAIVSNVQEGATARIAGLGEERRSAGWISTSGFVLALLGALALAVIAVRRQREARRSRAVLDSVLANAPVGIGFVDRSLEAQSVGEAGRHSELLGQFPVRREDVRAAIDGVFSSGRPAHNLEFAGSDASRQLRASLFPLRIGSDRSEGSDAVGFVIADISLRRKAEAKLREAEGRFRSLVEASSAIVWSVGPDGTFGGDQPGWAQFTGQDEAAYTGYGWLDAVHPDDRERSGEAWARATRELKPYSIEHRIRRADGIWREMLANAVPIAGADGAVREWIGTHTDLTEQKETASRLRETHSQFQALADNIPQMAWMAQPDGQIFWYNKRWFDFTGTTLEEMQGFGWVAVHHPDHADRVRSGFETALTAGRPWEDTFPLRASDGTYRWFLSQALPIRGEDGTILRWFGTNTDVTRQREQERELQGAKTAAENANRAKSQFIANMSHELRTPLTAVIGYTEMLEEEVQESGEAHLLGDLSKINANARHLLGLINDVLDLSKIEAERMEVHAEDFAIADTVSDIASAVGALMDKKGNRLVLDLPDDLGQAHTDEMKLRQCVINLLSNAAKFTENGTITLRVRRTSDYRRDWLTFDVADDGIGMSPDQLQRLFQRFTQADASTTRKFGGTGLGLAITKAFCKLLGGDIAVTSREGEGSTFTIKIPAIVIPAVSEQPEIAPVSADERRASAGLVLAIDDDPNARDLVSRFLTREGFIVRTAADGLSGLEMARALRPDAILLDVTMPRMDGWSVLAALKADADMSRIPVVMLTVIDEHSLGYALGASDYLLKPVEWDQLRRTMDRFRLRERAVILAVDDDPDLLSRMRSTLERENFAVVTAGNGRLALEALEAKTPDLIITDLLMPEMDGFAFIRAVRQRPETARVPIVVLTSKDLTREEFRKLRPHTEEVLSKRSIELPELAEQLRVIVRPDEAAPAAPAEPSMPGNPA